MQRASSKIRRRLAPAVLAAALAAGAGRAAADAPAAPDSIAAARRDLQALQAAADGAVTNSTGQIHLNLSLSAPSLAPPEPDTAPPPVDLSILKKTDDRSHWLLDAVEAQTKSDDARRHGQKSDGRDPADAEDHAAQNGRNANSDPGLASAPPGGSHAINPLGQYLGQWMTPQDYSLLGRPAAAPQGDAAISAATAPGADPSGLDAAAGATGTNDWLNPPGSTPAADSARSNPYLAGQNDRATEGSTSAVAGAGKPAAAPAANPAPPPDSAAARPSAVPPADDTKKYFPEIKDHF